MKNITLLFSFILCLSITSFSQTDKEEILQTINFLFEGMQKADTAIINKAFAKNVIMKVVSEENVKEETLDEFLTQVANKKEGTADWIEKLQNTEVRIDGSLAHVWTDYSFYVGDKFSHCGVNSFALIKLDGKWEIVYVMDTRRRDNCEQ